MVKDESWGTPEALDIYQSPHKVAAVECLWRWDRVNGHELIRDVNNSIILLQIRCIIKDSLITSFGETFVHGSVASQGSCDKVLICFDSSKSEVIENMTDEDYVFPLTARLGQGGNRHFWR
jgi:hypothetical protein